MLLITPIFSILKSHFKTCFVFVPFYTTSTMIKMQMTQKNIILLMVFGMASISLGGWLMASDEAFLRRTSMQVWHAIGLQMQPYKGGRSPSQGGPTKPSTTYPPNYTLDQRVQRYGTGEARPQQFVQTPTNYFFVPSIPPEPNVVGFWKHVSHYKMCENR